jgi:F0F1-type ATP synthase delta subunit
LIRGFARLYARAIIDVAGSPQKANEIRGELTVFAKALRTSEELRQFYANPGIEPEAKIATTQKLAGRMKLTDLAT